MKTPHAGTVKQLPNGCLAWTGQINFDQAKLEALRKSRKHRAWFVNSLSDLFHPNVSDEIVLKHFDVFAEVAWQEFRALSKRAERLVKLDSQIKWTDNVQMGVSVEDMKRLYRIALLGKTGAHHRFISFEPWLSPWPFSREQSISGAFPVEIEGVRYGRLRDLMAASRIETCIVGGESSRDRESARYCDPRDVEYLLTEAQAAGCRAILKQLGTRWAVSSNSYKLSAKGGNPLGWPEILREHPQEWTFLELPTWSESQVSVRVREPPDSVLVGE